MFFLLVNLFISMSLKNYFWLFFLFFPLCYSGYFGSTKYKKNYICLYNIYLLFMSIYYFTISIYYNIFWFLILFGLEFYFFCFSTKLYYYINIASNEIIDSLKNGWKPSQIVVYYF